MDHVLVSVFKQDRVFCFHRHRGTIVIDRFDTGKQGRVKIDAVIMSGQLRADFRVDSIEIVIRVRSGQLEKHQRHTAEHAAGFLQRQDRVVESGCVWIRGYRCNFGSLDRHALFKGRNVIVFADLSEIRRMERQGACFSKIACALRDSGSLSSGFCNSVHGLSCGRSAAGQKGCNCGCGQNLGLHNLSVSHVNAQSPAKKQACDQLRVTS